jgi:hypothetical protein
VGAATFTQDGQLPCPGVAGVDHLHSICPQRDVEGAGRTEVDEHRLRAVEESEDAQRTAGGDQVEIRHAPPEQRVSLAEFVVDVEAGDHPGDVLARLIHVQQLSQDVAQRDRPVVVAPSALCAMVFCSTRAPTGCRSVLIRVEQAHR